MGGNRDLDRLLRFFPEQAGVHDLHNTIHRRGKTCEICRGPLLNSKPWVCPRCRANKEAYESRAADRLGSVIYGCKGLESGDLMHRYKEARADGGDVLLVTALAAVAFRHHACVDSLAGMPPRNWATVPSLRRVGTEHAFRTILLQLLGQQSEIRVAAAQSARRANDSQRREVNPDFYDVITPVPRGSHVLVIDDTWVSGGHAQSVAMALKKAGAQQVSVLAVARWVDLQKPYPRWTYNNIIEVEPFAMDICPWTGGDCPPPRSSPVNEIRSKPQPPHCSLHNIALASSGECAECSKLIQKGKRRKPWYQFW
jgi:predicted amidophosphoribosyltransferase